ncbi:hypothetical protein [Prauserella cavernicola]|uniref:Uncharacterized protein n=1 Tax=Prauserella cavernicola TaxID=2800127 RepID=A0A934QQY9_9PSEU|nr:hypothetical protein [Prauserella cavernicola]MBK1785106.1 hypothetical protein [Prauserella cavernicola]
MTIVAWFLLALTLVAAAGFGLGAWAFFHMLAQRDALIDYVRAGREPDPLPDAPEDEPAWHPEPPREAYTDPYPSGRHALPEPTEVLPAVGQLGHIDDNQWAR